MVAMTVVIRVKTWHDRYQDKGLTVIAVHSPEFDEERKMENLRREVTSLGIRYPVVTDNDYQTWNAYHVEVLAHYLSVRQARTNSVDAQG